MSEFIKLDKDLKELDKNLDIEVIDVGVFDIVHKLNKTWLFRFINKNNGYKVTYLSKLMPTLELKILNLINTNYCFIVNYNEIVDDLKINIDNETISRPSRYQTKSGKQVLDLLKEDLLSDSEYIGFLKGNFYKYIYRYQRKNGKEDLEKAQFYLEELKNYEYKD